MSTEMTTVERNNKILEMFLNGEEITNIVSGEPIDVNALVFFQNANIECVGFVSGPLWQELNYIGIKDDRLCLLARNTGNTIFSNLDGELEVQEVNDYNDQYGQKISKVIFRDGRTWDFEQEAELSEFEKREAFLKEVEEIAKRYNIKYDVTLYYYNNNKEG